MMMRRYGLSNLMFVSLFTTSILQSFFEAATIGAIIGVASSVLADTTIDAPVSIPLPGWDSLVSVFPVLSSQTAVIVLTIVLFLSRQILSFTTTVLFHHARVKMLRVSRARLFSAYLNAELNIFGAQTIGEEMSRLTREVDSLINFSLKYVLLFVDLARMAVFGAAIASVSVESLLGLIVMSVLAAFLLSRWIGLAREKGRLVASSNKGLSSYLVERLSSIRLIKLAGTERIECEAMDNLNHKNASHTLALQVNLAAVQAAAEPLFVLLLLAGLGLMVKQFGIGVADSSYIVLVAIRAVPILRSCLQQYQSVLGNAAAFEDVIARDNVLQKHSEQRVRTDVPAQDLPAKFNRIDVKSVSYSYPGSDVKTINDVSLSFRSGEVTHLFGPSGAGKSTVIDLVSRLIEPSSGTIEVNGIDVRSFDTTKYRARISFVPQNPRLINVPIRAYLSYGYEELSEDEISKVLDEVGLAEEFARNDWSLDSSVGDGGQNMSGGQRQRLEIARALARDPQVLVFDEPTSALDQESERRVIQCIMECAERGCMVILVSHNPDLRQLANVVYRFDAGTVERIQAVKAAAVKSEDRQSAKV